MGNILSFVLAMSMGFIPIGSIQVASTSGIESYSNLIGFEMSVHPRIVIADSVFFGIGGDAKLLAPIGMDYNRNLDFQAEVGYSYKGIGEVRVLYNYGFPNLIGLDKSKTLQEQYLKLDISINHKF